MTGTWPSGWATGDVETAAEFKKGIGAIFDSTLGGSAANVDVTSISATYAHLLIWVYARGDTAATNTGFGLRFNNDSAANYDYQRLGGGGAVVLAVEQFAQALLLTGFMPANTGTANCFSANCIFIPNYAGSTNNKMALSISATKSSLISGGMFNYILGGGWRSSAAINRVTLVPSAGNFVAGTRVTIYGMGA